MEKQSVIGNVVVSESSETTIMLSNRGLVTKWPYPLPVGAEVVVTVKIK